MKKILCLYFIISFVVNTFAIQSSGESVNPFNQFMSPSGGVDLYSGAAAFTVPIISLTGYKGPDVSVALSYSSNVTVNARSSNTVSGTSWVGLGWSFELASIKCNHKGTESPDDDDYYYIAGPGSTNRFLRPDRLKFKYYRGVWVDSLPDFDTLTPAEEGYCTYFNVGRNDDHYYYAFIFEGKINLHVDGEYEFYLTSDDGSKLFIDGQLVVNNNGINHVYTEKSGRTTYLQRGFHSIKVEYFQYNGPKELIVKYLPPSGNKRTIPIQDLLNPDVKENDLYKEFYIENNPYLKCDNIDFNNDKIIDSWIITNIDGSKMIFGKMNVFDTAQDAIRFTFADNGYVGTFLSGSPKLYPYQWDLRAVVSPYGDTVRYWYQQEKEGIVSGSYDSRSAGLYYTKASYPDSIVNSNGKSLKFELEQKTDSTLNEPYDPHNYIAEPDAFMEMYESKRLKKIHIYSPESNRKMKTIEFSYDFLNRSRGDLFCKSLLKSIVWRNNISGRIENRYDFEYNDDSLQAGTFNAAYHYGAIQSIYDFHGEKTNYVYKQISQNEQGGYQYDDSTGYYLYNNAKLVENRNLTGNITGPYLYGNHGMPVYGGNYDNGKEFVVLLGGLYHNKLWLYTFDGHNWVLDKEFKNKFLSFPGRKIVTTFENGFLYHLADSTDNNAQIVFWQNGKWVVNDITIKNNNIDDIKMGNDFIVCRGGSGKNQDYVWVYRKKENDWLPDSQYYGKKFFPVLTNKRMVATGNNFFTVTVDSTKSGVICRWDGSKWIEVLMPNTYPEIYRNVYACNNYFVITGGEHWNYMWLYYWNGTQWCSTQYACTEVGLIIEPVKLYLGSDYFVFRPDSPLRKPKAVTWDGSGWREQILEITTPLYTEISVFPGSDYICIQGTGKINPLPKVILYNKKNKRLTGPSDSIWIQNKSWSWFNDVDSSKIIDEIELCPGSNSFAITTKCSKSSSCGADMYRWVYRWDGTDWEKIYHSKTFCIPFQQNEPETNIRHGICGTSGGYCFSTMSYVLINNEYKPHEINVEFIHRFQDNYDSIRSYVVERKDVISTVTAETLTTAFEYENGRFDAYIGAIKFNKVKVLTDSAGSTESYFFNDGIFDYSEQLSNSDKFDGIVYKTIMRNEKGTSISENRNFYQLFKQNYWPDGLFSRLVTKTMNLNMGMLNKTIIPVSSYNEFGLPSLSILIPQDLNPTPIITKTVFAFEKYPEMKGRYMVSQPCQTIIYRKNYGAENDSMIANDVIASNVNTWKYFNTGNGFWNVCSNFVWRAPCDSNGLPEPDNYHSFDFSNPGANTTTNWVYQGSISKHNNIGIPIETSDYKNRKSVVILGTPRELPIASITLSAYDESGVFTGDYKKANSSLWWDYENGWEKGQHAVLISDSTKVHFGQKVISLSSGIAASRNTRIYPGNSYSFSAWVKAENGAIYSGADFRYATTNDQGNWPVRQLQIDSSKGFVIDSLIPSNTNGEWRLLKVIIPATMTSKLDTQREWYVHSWIGRDSLKSGSLQAYIDDIRFHPENAKVITTFYDTIFYNPIVTVDDNNNPGVRIKYDDSGRPIQWFKFSKYIPSYQVLLSSKKYHAAGE